MTTTHDHHAPTLLQQSMQDFDGALSERLIACIDEALDGIAAHDRRVVRVSLLSAEQALPNPHPLRRALYAAECAADQGNWNQSRQSLLDLRHDLA